MVAVIVRVETPIDPETSAAFPEARTTIIVSPIARPNPRTSEAKIPGIAAGRTTREIIWKRSEPSASAAVLYDVGTARSASSETVKMSGQTASERPMPATSALSRCSVPNARCTQVASTISAKNPMTTDGMPAKSSTTGLMISRSRRRANSDT